ncbi:hypothetical protein KR222_008823, partial [Zaprionus bogoriensis]
VSSALLSVLAAPTDEVTHPPPLEELIVEGRAKKQEQDAIEAEDDLDGRSAYVNNQFVPNDAVELNDEQNAPLYEILQKQMEQVLAASGPDVPIYEDDKSKRQREQQLPNKPLFTQHNNEAEADDDYMDETASELEPEDQSYADAEKPDAAVAEEPLPAADGYQMPQLSTSSARPTESTTGSSSSTTSSTTQRSRPQRRRSTTTALPRTTRSRNGHPTKSTPAAANQTELATTTTTAAPPAATSHKPRPQNKPSYASNSLPHDPQIYQHKRRIIFKTISTGSQFVNSPIGDLMIKFSIGFAKPAQGVATPSNEALRALSNNLLRNMELQRLRRFKVQKD